MLDDHSRYLLSGGWFRSQHTVNVFACVGYPGPSCRSGLPKAILSDRRSQFHPTGRRGQADFEDAMARLGIRVIVARRARTKGKIERRFGFVQRDVMLEHLQERLNAAWHAWLRWSNHRFHSQALGGHTASQHYRPSSRRRSKVELQVLLTHEEPRRVRLDGTISDYGRDDRVPAGYLTCRVWTTLRGETLRIEALGRTIATHRLVP